MATLTGRDGNDKITGTELDDTIDGRLGNDILNGLGGSDTIYGKGGDDTLDGGGATDFLYGGTGRDHLSGGDGDDFLVGNEGDDSYRADPDDDILEGGAGGDYLQAARGQLYGGLGDDNLHGIKVVGGDVTMYGGPGNDWMDGAEITAAYGGIGDDTVQIRVFVSYQPTILDGGSGFDTLRMGDPTEEANKILDLTKVVNFEQLLIVDYIPPAVPIILTDNLASEGSTFFVKFDSTDGATDHIVIDGSEETDAHLDITAPLINSIYGGQLSDVIRGSGNLYGNGGDDELIGVGESEDRFTGGTGGDRIDGGDGLDTAVYSGAYANYTVTEVTFNTFTVTDNVGTDGTDTIIDVNKLQFSDQTVDVVIRGIEIIGDETADSLTGGDFSDHLDGAGGADTLSGGDGNDLIDGGEGADKVAGDIGNDLLNGDAGADQLAGGDGNDLLDGGADGDTLSGGAGNDTLTGGSGDDTVLAGGGSDLIVGGHGAGNDTYDGGDGVDTVRYLSALSGIIVDLGVATNQAQSIAVQDAAGIGIDQLKRIENVIGGNFADRLYGNTASNTLSGAAGNDILLGLGGNDTLDGGTGVDIMRGGAGNDTYVVDNSKDQVSETAGQTTNDAGGIDSVRSSISYDLARTNGGGLVENLALLGTTNLSGRGNALGNGITGNDGNNALFGKGGDDSLTGGGGLDRLSGGAGSDTLRGGIGGDRFIFDSAATASDLDVIADYSRRQGDKILFSLKAFGGLGAAGKLTADKFYSATGATQAHDASDRIIYDKATGTLYYDADGIGGVAALAVAVLGTDTHPGLAFSDILIVA